MKFETLTTTDALKKFCDGCHDKPFVAVDTEFLRETTYWPQLCLIQIAHESEAVIVDPLAEGMDLAPFFELLTFPKVVNGLCF